jgi:uncharacterized protein YndB with AHSA1/START domain
VRIVARYDFTTVWELDAPIERVWGAIWDAERWPHWWSGVESVTAVEPGDERGLGSITRYVWRSRLPYDLSFDMRVVRVREPVELIGIANGELAGEGHWRLHRTTGGTLVRYEWRVYTTRRWMNLLGRLGRPLFAWNHDAVMAQGGAGLAAYLGRVDA